MSFKSKFIALVLLAECLCAPVGASEKVRIVTEHLPPYQFIGTNNKLTGLGVDIVKLMFAELGEQPKIELLPWARAYDLALNHRNVMIFTILRSEQRQKQFKWVGDFLVQNYYFLALKNRGDINIRNIQDVKQHLVGVSRDSFEHQLLLKYGFYIEKNLHVNVAQLPLIEMLYAGKVDMIFGSKITLLGLIDYVKHDRSKIKLVYRINESLGHVGIAFSKLTDDKLVRKYRQAFTQITRNGSLQQTTEKWLKASAQ